MHNQLTTVFGCALILCLSGCTSTRALTTVPNLAVVEITKDTSCAAIKAQTADQTCPGIGNADPEGFVCRNPDSRSQRRIHWSAADPFTLEFPNGHPFANTSGHCDIATLDKDKTCVVKLNDGTLQPMYKYNIVFTTSCRVDPHIFLTR